MRKDYLLKNVVSMATMILGFPMLANAGWGTTEQPEKLYAHDGEIAGMKTARTADGKTFITWLQWSGTAGWGYEMHMQLLDIEGNPLWGESGMVVETKRNASWTADYWLVATPEGDAVVSWADARYEEEAEYADGHVSVLYKISQDQEQLWGEDGLLLGDEYKYPATLYMFGEDLYAIMQPNDDYAPSKLVRLDSDGEFAVSPIEFAGQLIASEGTDFIGVYAGSAGTEAMRLDRNLQKVWDSPAVVSKEIYGGYERNPYKLVSDGKGGVVVSFSRNMNMLQHMPVVQYVSADGEAVFGDSVDVSTNDVNDHNYAVIGVNPEEQTIMSAWQMSSGVARLQGQTLDFFGERMWGDEGLVLVEKGSESGYTYGPMTLNSLPDNTWLVCYADEQWWAHSQIYFANYDANGNENWCKPVGQICAVDDYVTYLEGNNYYLFWVNQETDDDWNTVYSIECVKMSDFLTGIRGVEDNAMHPESTEYYNLNGVRINSLAKGLNIVRDVDGTVKKVIVK